MTARTLASLPPAHDVTGAADAEDMLAPLSTTQRDFTEMMLMSRARHIFAPVSNFSGFAKLMGDAPPTTVHALDDSGGN